MEVAKFRLRYSQAAACVVIKSMKDKHVIEIQTAITQKNDGHHSPMLQITA